MEILVPAGILAVASGLMVLAWRRLSGRRSRHVVRDDMRRVGADTAPMPDEAARRAGDRNSWMIPSGF